jgi:hypothetical protein
MVLPTTNGQAMLANILASLAILALPIGLSAFAFWPSR